MSSTKINYVSNKDLYTHYLNWHEALEKAKKAEKPTPPIPAPIVDAIIKITTRLSYSPEFINYSFREDLVSDAQYDCIRFADKFNPKKVLHKAVLKYTTGMIKVKDVVVGQTSGLTGKVKYKNEKTGLVSLDMPEGQDFTLGETITSPNGSATIEKIATHFSDNPFSYLTTVAVNAFYRRIDAEKTQSYIKAKIIAETPIHEFYDSIDPDDVELQNSFTEFLAVNADNTDNMVNNEPMAIKRKRKRAAEKAALSVVEPDGVDSDETTLELFCGDEVGEEVSILEALCEGAD